MWADQAGPDVDNKGFCRQVRVMKGFGLNSWTTGDAVDAMTDIRVAAAAGYRFVELRDAKIERCLAGGGSLEALREAADRAGLGVLSVNTLERATLHDEDGLAPLIARCRTLGAWARALGCPFVIVGPSYLDDPGADADPARIRERTAQALGHLAAAAGPEVRIAFEFHGYARCSVNTLGEAVAILDDLGDDRVGLVVDAFHFHVGGSRLADLRALDPSRLFIVHLADVDHDDRSTLGRSNRVLPGDGVLPLLGLVSAIQETGYDGPYSLELFRPEYWAMAPEVVARLGIERMRRFA